MLTRLAVKGFKALADVEIELGQINVFVGANGSGKTSVLEALGMLGAAASGRVDDAALLSRGVRAGVPALLKTSLRNRRSRPAIELEASWGDGASPVCYRVSLSNAQDSPQPAWSYRTETLSGGGPSVHPLARTRKNRSRIAFGRGDTLALDVAPDSGLAPIWRGLGNGGSAATALWDALAGYGCFAPVTPVLRGTAPDPQPASPLGRSGGGLAEACDDVALHHSADWRAVEHGLSLIGWATDVQSVAPSRQLMSASVPTQRRSLRFTDRCMLEGRDMLSAYDASEGALYVLFAMVLAVHPDTPRLFAIDNFDQALNPLLARRLTTLFCDTIVASEDHRQVLLTTHSPQVLDGIDLKDDRIRLFVVDRNRDGSARVDPIRITPDLIDLAAQNGYSLSRLWLSGRLGGLPEI